MDIVEIVDQASYLTVVVVTLGILFSMWYSRLHRRALLVAVFLGLTLIALEFTDLVSKATNNESLLPYAGRRFNILLNTAFRASIGFYVIAWLLIAHIERKAKNEARREDAARRGAVADAGPSSAKIPPAGDE